MRKWLLPLLALFFVAGTVHAERSFELKAEIAVSADTGLPTRIIITGYNPRATIWLGMSLYPYLVKDPITGGHHSFKELPHGEFHNEIPIDSTFWGGSFELGLWGKKVPKVDCTIDQCYWCKKFGFHVDESLAYKSGLLTRMTGYK